MDIRLTRGRGSRKKKKEKLDTYCYFQRILLLNPDMIFAGCSLCMPPYSFSCVKIMPILKPGAVIGNWSLKLNYIFHRSHLATGECQINGGDGVLSICVKLTPRLYIRFLISSSKIPKENIFLFSADYWTKIDSTGSSFVNC